MFAQGMAGMLRRMYDGGINYATANVPGAIGGLSESMIHMNQIVSIAAWCLGLAQIPFIINFFWSIKHGKKDQFGQSVGSHHAWNGRRPRRRRTAISSRPPVVYRGPYEYSVPGRSQRFHAAERSLTSTLNLFMEIPYTSEPRQDTGLFNAKVGIWLFLASEVMLFGALFSSYILLRVGAGAGRLAARVAECLAGHDQHHRADHFQHHGRHGLGVAQDEELRPVQNVSGRHDALRRGVSCASSPTNITTNSPTTKFNLKPTCIVVKART